MKIIFILPVILFASLFAQAQVKPVVKSAPVNSQSAKSSPAYAEILLQKTELSSELEDLLVEYTEEYPKVKELRFKLNSLQKDLEKLLAVADASKLSVALGKLMVRKTELAADVWNLQRQYADDHPDVKRAKRKVEVFEQAIKEILQ
jgi:uncharacterized protein involved in exopolysaccharide biosynthesis